MDDLLCAIEVRRKYLDMDFDNFAKMVEEHIGREIPQSEKDNFRYMGLNNIDFLKMYI